MGERRLRNVRLFPLIIVLVLLSSVAFLCIAFTSNNSFDLLPTISRKSSVFEDRQNPSSSSSFESPSEALLQEWDEESIPVPFRVMEQYIQWHSVKSLGRDPTNRKFALGFYSCPLQAGNRLHHFFNGLLWAIITNRTLLWKYWDSETCSKYDGKHYDVIICEAANTVDACDKILKRAAWIPSYDEWSERLGHFGGKGKDFRPYELPYFATHHPNVSDVNQHFRWGTDGNDDSAFGVDNTTKYPQRVVIFPQERFKDTLLQGDSSDSLKARNTMLQTEWSRQIAEKVYSLGPDFLYGMLHRYSFAFSENVLKASTQLGNDDDYTVALHSRHRFVELDGCDIRRETSCLDKVLSRKNQTQRCVVAIMSDRECTITRLTPWLEKRDCAVQMAQHSSGDGLLAEHGPFAGAGFFQDLALVSKARSAFVGMERSSSDLLLELIEFNRVYHALSKGGPHLLSKLEELDICVLPFEGPSTKGQKVV